MKIEGHEIIFKTLVGSHSYGTNIEGSDVDYKGVFIQDPKDAYINGYKEQIDVSKDEVYFELGRFLNLCATGNPTILELLYAPKDCIQYIHPIYEDILSIRDIFLTKTLRYSFGRYAIEQIRKASGLDKKMNWEKAKMERKSVEDMCSVYPFERIPFWKFWKKRHINNAIDLKTWLNNRNLNTINCGLTKIEHFRDCYLLFNNNKCLSYRGITSGKDSTDVSLSEIPIGEKPIGMLFFHKDAYSTNCKKWNEYEKWLKERNTQRYVDIEGHGQKIDGKNILHCVRLIETSMEIPTLKTLNVRRENNQFLIEIRKGKHDLKTLLDKCESDLKLLDQKFINSDLPDKFEHKDLIDSLISDVKEQYFDRTVSKVTKKRTIAGL